MDEAKRQRERETAVKVPDRNRKEKKKDRMERERDIGRMWEWRDEGIKRWRCWRREEVELMESMQFDNMLL